MPRGGTGLARLGHSPGAGLSRGPGVAVEPPASETGTSPLDGDAQEASTRVPEVQPAAAVAGGRPLAQRE
ncbi:hypothetical protein EAD98_10225 [Micromonospora sp. CV4]|nr:hypothetical protein EAD98_10225 [Micromonospora sp. CV4]